MCVIELTPEKNKIIKKATLEVCEFFNTHRYIKTERQRSYQCIDKLGKRHVRIGILLFLKEKFTTSKNNIRKAATLLFWIKTVNVIHHSWDLDREKKFIQSQVKSEL